MYNINDSSVSYEEKREAYSDLIKVSIAALIYCIHNLLQLNYSLFICFINFPVLPLYFKYNEINSFHGLSHSNWILKKYITNVFWI